MTRKGPSWTGAEHTRGRDGRSGALREQGIPVIGFTWYSLQDQVDWDIAMASVRRLVNPVGLYDLNRRANPAAHAYRQLLEKFQGLPALPLAAECGANA